MPAAAQHRAPRTSRLVRKLAIAGTGVAVLALPLIGATTASAATPAVQTATTLGYANNLDGWIRASLAVMAEHGIPGSYDGIYRNVIRESSGNPYAINLWDSNAAAGDALQGPAPGDRPDLQRLPRGQHLVGPVRPGREHHRGLQLRGPAVRVHRQRVGRVLGTTPH